MELLYDTHIDAYIWYMNNVPMSSAFNEESDAHKWYSTIHQYFNGCKHCTVTWDKSADGIRF